MGIRAKWLGWVVSLAKGVKFRGLRDARRRAKLHASILNILVD